LYLLNIIVLWQTPELKAVVAWRLREEVRLSKEVNLLKFVAVGPATNGGQTSIMKPRVVTSKIKR